MIALLLAAGLSIVSPATARWDASASKHAPAPAHVDVVLRNGNRTPLVWVVTDLPPWAACWVDPARPELGQRRCDWLAPGETATVRVDLASVPPAYVPGVTYLADVRFTYLGSSAPDPCVDCTLAVTP
jgi:hypothetical protein